MLVERADETAQYGCPYGTLSPELAKRAEGSDPLATPLMQVLLDWAEQKFRAMGRPDAPDLAVELGLPTRAAPPRKKPEPFSRLAAAGT